MSKKITVYVLGGSGMLGFQVVQHLSQNKHLALHVSVRSSSQVQALKKLLPTHVTFFLYDAEKNKASLSTLIKKGSYIINCVGIIKPYIQEDDVKSVRRAVFINTLFPYELTSIAIKKSCRILQIATDCVYNGEKGNYIESNPHNAIDVYGKTKSLGEINSPCVNNIRTSIIGPEFENKISLLEWFLAQKKNAVVKGFKNHYWNGVTTLCFAKIIETIIMHNIHLPPTIHLVPADTVSKYELLLLFKKYFRPDITVKKIKAEAMVNRILATEFATINKRLWKLTGYKDTPGIEEMIRELTGHNS